MILKVKEAGFQPYEKPKPRPSQVRPETPIEDEFYPASDNNRYSRRFWLTVILREASKAPPEHRRVKMTFCQMIAPFSRPLLDRPTAFKED